MPSQFIRKPVKTQKRRRIKLKQRKKAIRKIIPKTTVRPPKKIKPQAMIVEKMRSDVEPMGK